MSKAKDENAVVDLKTAEAEAKVQEKTEGTESRAVDDGATFQALGINLPKPTRKKVSLENVVADLKLNLRHSKSQNKHGVDTYNLGQMKNDILTDRQINKEIVLEDLGNNKLQVLAGFRRTLAGQALLADKNTPQDVAEALHNVAAVVYPALDDRQRLAIINDQDTQKFMYSEIVGLIFRLYDQQYNWKQVAYAIYQQWADFHGRRALLNEINAITEPVARQNRIQKWLKGSIYEVYGTAHEIGPVATEMLMLEALEKDRLIQTVNNTPKGTVSDPSTLHPGPYIRLGQKELDRLKEAKEADKANREWNAYEGGPAFQEVMEAIRAEQQKSSTVTQKSLTSNALETLAKNASSSLATLAFEHASGKKGVKWSDTDKEFALIEYKVNLYHQMAGEMAENSPVKKALYMALNKEVDNSKFKEYIESLIVVKEKEEKPKKK